MSGFVVHVAYTAQPGQAERALAEIRQLVAEVLRLEPECLGIDVLVNQGDPHRLLLCERWSSHATFVGPHMQQPHLQAFIARAPQFLAGPPEISFWRAESEERSPGLRSPG